MRARAHTTRQVDEKSGLLLYCWAQDSKVLSLLATIVNTVVDDGIYVVGLSIGWLGTLWARRNAMIVSAHVHTQPHALSRALSRPPPFSPSPRPPPPPPARSRARPLSRFPPAAAIG